MSVDRVFARAQAQRLRFCKYFPGQDAEEYFKEICNALVRAKNDIIASMVIDEWLEEQTERPAPADIHKAVARHNGALVADTTDLGDPPSKEEAEAYNARNRQFSEMLESGKTQAEMVQEILSWK